LLDADSFEDLPGKWQRREFHENIAQLGERRVADELLDAAAEPGARHWQSLDGTARSRTTIEASHAVCAP